MTGKRFSLFEDLDIKDNATGRIIPPCLDRGLNELVDLLNELDEKYIDEFALRETLQQELQRIEKENEQLRHDATILIQSNQDYRRENEQLKQFKDKVYSVIDKRIDLLESDYNKAVKAGMPSNSVYSEIELLEDLKKELEE